MGTANIHGNCEWVVEPGKLDDFVAHVAALIETVQATQSDTLDYQWYFNDDRSRSFLVMRHADLHSLMAMLQHVGPSLPKLLDSCRLERYQVFGDVPDDIRITLTGLEAVVYRHHAGFSR